MFKLRWVPVSICLIAAFSETMTEHLEREITDFEKKGILETEIKLQKLNFVVSLRKNRRGAVEESSDRGETADF